MNTKGNVYANSRYEIFKELNLGDVRTYIDEKGVIWFYMNDIARILDIKNPRDITAKLRKMGLGGSVEVSDTPTYTKNQHINFSYNVKETIIKESALLFLCGSSRKPNAIKLFRFVSEQVVPSLARYGGYIMSEDRQMYKDNPSLVQDLIKANEEIDSLKSQLEAGRQYIEEEKTRYDELVSDYNELLEENEDLQNQLMDLEGYGYSLEA